MERIVLSDEIEAIVSGKPYTTDSIGMSGSAVPTYPDMLFDVQTQSPIGKS